MSEITPNIPAGVADAYERVIRYANTLFVGEEMTTSVVQWDDGDFRVEAYHGFDTRRSDIQHGEQIRYKHSDGEITYSNFVRKHGWHTEQALKEYVVEEWEPGEEDERTECGAPRARERDGQCTRMTPYEYCHHHLHLLGDIEPDR